MHELRSYTVTHRVSTRSTVWKKLHACISSPGLRRGSGLLGSCLLLGGCSNKTASADSRLKAIYTAEWKWREDQFPDGEDSQKPVQDHLPKVDPATQTMRLARWQDTLAQLDALPHADLSAPEQLNYAVYRPQIETLLANQRFRDFEMPANSDSTFWTDLGYTARRPFRNLQDYRNWISQMHDIPRYFDEETDEMRRGLKRGFTPPRVTLAGRDASLTAVTEATPEGSLFYTPFKDMPGVSDADKAALREQAIAVIRDTVQPAYRRLLAFIRNEYVPGARTSLAAYELPDGKNYYRAKIREFTTLDEDPEAIHALGESEVRRLHAAMLAVMRETGFQGDFPAFLAFLRSDPQFQAKTPQEHEIETEVDRYIAWPAQALSYYLGEDAIRTSRGKAERALGARFNVRAFHDAVLELGSVPIPVLSARVDRFIAAGGRGPYPDLE